MPAFSVAICIIVKCTCCQVVEFFRKCFIEKCRVLPLISCLESCKKCGRFGSEESFYGRSKNYCSVKCAQSFRFKQQSQSSTPDAASPTSSVQVAVLSTI